MTLTPSHRTLAFGDRVLRWRRDTRGASVAELALVMPVLLTFLLGGVEVSRALVTYRKVTDTTTQLSSVISTNPASIALSDLKGQTTAASLIMNPMPAAPMTVTVTEIETAPASNPTAPFATACTGPGSCPAIILWQVTANPATNVLTPGKNVANTPYTQLPTSLGIPGMGYTLVQVSYPYPVTIGLPFLGQPQIPMSDQLYMTPREVPWITCGDCST